MRANCMLHDRELLPESEQFNAKIAFGVAFTHSDERCHPNAFHETQHVAKVSGKHCGMSSAATLVMNSSVDVIHSVARHPCRVRQARTAPLVGTPLFDSPVLMMAS